MEEAPDLNDGYCSICFDSSQFRVLQCGHAFCLDCLQTMHAYHGGKILCPMDRREDAREPRTLPTPHQFQGHVFIPAVDDDERHVDLNYLLDTQIKHRLDTIRKLRTLASTLEGHEFNCAIAKVTGSAAGIVGSVMAMVGIGLSFTGVGAFVGVPLAITGAGVGVAGGATTGITAVVETVLQKDGVQEVQEDLQLDYFKSEQIKVILVRGALNPDFAERWQIDASNLINAGNIIPRLVKLGVTTAAGVRVALGIGRAATTTGLHVAGLVLAAAVIPLDLAQMIISSIRIHKKEPSKVVKEILDLADSLEKQLRLFLIGDGYFQFIYTNDGQWAYIQIHARKMKQFKDGLVHGYTLAQLEGYGVIVETGEGEVPSDIERKMQDEWYSYYDEMVAQALQEELNNADE